MKLVTAFIAPLIIVDLIQTNFTHPQQKTVNRTLALDILLWIAACLLIFILVGISCHSLSYRQLWQTHFDASVKEAFNAGSSLKLTLVFLLQDFDYLLMSVAAVIALIKTKQWAHLFPFTWLIAAFIVLLTHRPVWYHHYLLFSLPLTWVATYGLTMATRGWQLSRKFGLRIKPIKHWSLKGFMAGCLIFSIFCIPIKLSVTQYENQRSVAQSEAKNHVVDVMREYKPFTHWVFTDCPIYPFYSGLPVPPEIAVLSLIRIKSNMITREQLLAVLEKYQPEQALLCKSATLRNDLEAYIQQHYVKIDEYSIGTHYLIKSLMFKHLSDRKRL
jgi:hypothetical protein